MMLFYEISDVIIVPDQFPTSYVLFYGTRSFEKAQIELKTRGWINEVDEKHRTKA